MERAGEDDMPRFTVRLVGGVALSARRVIVATGLRDELPDIPGVRERWGKDLLHCPYCHGYEVGDQPLGVLGTSPGAVRHALLLRQWSDDVVLFRHGLELTDDDRRALSARQVPVIEGTVKRLVVEDDRLRGVELAEDSAVARSTVFVVPRMVPRDGLLTALGCERGADGWIATDRSGLTSVPGVWAVGNVVDPRALVVSSGWNGLHRRVRAQPPAGRRGRRVGRPGGCPDRGLTGPNRHVHRLADARRAPEERPAMDLTEPLTEPTLPPRTPAAGPVGSGDGPCESRAPARTPGPRPDWRSRCSPSSRPR